MFYRGHDVQHFTIAITKHRRHNPRATPGVIIRPAKPLKYLYTYVYTTVVILDGVTLERTVYKPKRTVRCGRGGSRN